MIVRMKKKVNRLLVVATFLVGVAVVVVAFSFNQDSQIVTLNTNLDLVKGEIKDDLVDKEFDLFFDNLPLNQVQDLIIDNVASVNNAINPSIKYVHITQGLRKEQVAERFGKVLDWPQTEMDQFANADHPNGLPNSEGYYYPGTYAVYKGENSASASKKMFDRFEEEVTSRYGTSTAKIININTALKIASLIEREAAGKHDMRLISGIIWNRVFSGMNLEIDATLQYAKGTEENGWWPMVYSKDKYIDSPYNTYKHSGFPPTAISNPGLASVYAALNPQKTDCIFYLHDTRRQIHCTKTYAAHKKNIEKYY